MIFEWIRFFAVAFFLIFGLCIFAAEVIGVYRFGFVMNRIHAAGMGDSLGILSVTLAMMLSRGFTMDILKMALILIFMWFTSPASTHFLSQVEYYTNPHLYDHVRRRMDASELEEETGDRSVSAEMNEN